MGDLKRSDLMAGMQVRQGYRREATLYRVATPNPVNTYGQEVKGGRYVQLHRVQKDGTLSDYPTRRTVSELCSEGTWQRVQREADAKVVAEHGDRRMEREAAAADEFFTSVGSPDCVHERKHTTLDGDVYVIEWGVSTYRLDEKLMLQELGVISAPDNDKKEDE